MSERRYIDEHAKPQKRDLRKDSHPGMHDPAIVASRVLADTVNSARTHAARAGDEAWRHEGELWRISRGGRPNYWTDRMETQLGEFMPPIAQGAADYLKRGDRSTSMNDGVGVGVSDERLAAQKAAYEAELKAREGQNVRGSGLAGAMGARRAVRADESAAAALPATLETAKAPARHAALPAIGDTAIAATIPHGNGAKPALFGGSSEATTVIRGYDDPRTARHDTDATTRLSLGDADPTTVLRPRSVDSPDSPTINLGRSGAFEERFGHLRDLRRPTYGEDRTVTLPAGGPTGEQTVAIHPVSGSGPGEATTVIPQQDPTRPLTLGALQGQQ